MITKYKLFEKLNSRGSSLTEEEFNQVLKSFCRNWTKAKTSLYRGKKDTGPYLYFDPTGTYRKSIDEENTHVEMMDNLPSWQNYPKYSQSIIGISSYQMSEDYSEKSYEIIPFDNIDIAICPKSTIWDSFGGFGNDDAIIMTHRFLENNNINGDIWESDGKTIEDHLKGLININQDQEFIKQASEYFKKNNITGEDCYKFLNDYLFNPKVRNFELVKYVPGFEVEPRRQIWTNGPVLLIYSELS